MKNIILFLMFFSINIYANFYNIVSDSTTKSIFTEIDYTFTSGNNLIKSTLSADNISNKIAFGCVLATTFFFDNPIYKTQLNQHYPSISKPVDFFKNFGEIKIFSPLAITTYAVGYFFDNQKLYEIGRDLTNSLFYTGMIVTTIKTLTGRSRPFTNDGPTKYKFYRKTFDYTSFPSGHAAVAFTFATVLSNHLQNDFASLILYTIATGTAFQRIYSNNHWLSDVVFSSVFAYNVADIISNKKHKPDNAFIIYPDYRNNGLGLLVRF